MCGRKQRRSSAQLGDWPHFNAFFIVWACVGFVLLLWVTRRLGLPHTSSPAPLRPACHCVVLHFALHTSRRNWRVVINQFACSARFLRIFLKSEEIFLLILRSIFAAFPTAFPVALIYDILMSNQMWIVNGRWRRNRKRHRKEAESRRRE